MSNPPKLCAPDLRAAIQPASPEKEPLVPLKIHGKRMFSALFSSDHITVEEMEGPWVDARPSSAESVCIIRGVKRKKINVGQTYQLHICCISVISPLVRLSMSTEGYNES